MPGSAQIGNLAVNLSLETAAFQRGAKIAETRVEGMRAKFAGLGKVATGVGIGLASLGTAAVIGGITAVAKNAFDMASALSESAEKMGVSVEALQELNLAAEQSGISQESLAGAMAKLNKNMGLLQQGSPQAVAAFAKIGIAADDLKGKTPDEALRLIADALNKLPDVQQRVAVGAALMGRGFSELLPLINLGSAGIGTYVAKSKEMGEISTADAKRLDELSDSWDRFKVRIGVATATFIASASRIDDGIIIWYNFRDKVVAAVVQMHASVISSINAMVDGIASAITNRLGAIWEGAKAKIASVKSAFHEMYDAVVGHSYVPDMIDGIARSMSELQKIMVDPALSATSKVGAAFQSLAGLMGSLFGQKAGSIIGAIGQFASALGPLFGGGGSIADPLAGFQSGGFGALKGFASGGSGVFGGRSGVDRNVLSLNGSPIARVSKGENFSVGNTAPTMAKVLIVPTPYFDAHVQGQAAAVAAPMAGQAAVMGATGGMSGIMRRSARTLP